MAFPHYYKIQNCKEIVALFNVQDKLKGNRGSVSKPNACARMRLTITSVLLDGRAPPPSFFKARGKSSAFWSPGAT